MLQDRNLLRPPFQLALRSLLLGSLSLTTFLACSDSGKDGQVGDDTEASLGGEGGGPSDPAEDDPGAEGTGGTANGKKIEELKLKPLSLESTTACALDSDCQAGASCFQNICAIECETDDECLSGESCNERGRCVDEDGKTVASSVFSGARIAEVLDPVRSVSIGQSFAQVQLEKDAPAGGLLYISGEREDGMAQLARATVDPDDKTIVRFDLPAKTAAKSRRVNIRTAAGPVAVVENDPSLSSGTYAGTLLLDGFGSLGVPLRFTIQTSSEDGSLSQDSPAWIVFDVAGDNLFSPTNGEVQSVARELVFDEFSQAWVAQVAQPWILDEDSLFPWLGGLETTRSMRFELTSTEVGFTGTVKDIWSGFYEERDGIGKLDQQPVSLSGTLDVTFVNSVEFAEPTVDTYVAQTPALFPLPALSECLDGVLKAASFDTGSETLDCASTASLDDFESGGAEDAARCALAVAGNALEGETVSAQIDTYIAGGSVGARSFAEYLDACAANEDDICLPSQEILCARQLTAHALKRQPSNSAYIDQLLAQFQAATREANLGAQFGAFHADANHPTCVAPGLGLSSPRHLGRASTHGLAAG